MPELPEVETIRRALQIKLVGETVTAIEVLHPKVIAPLAAEEFTRRINGACFTAIERRGKYLLCKMSYAGTESNETEGERPALLSVHLRMTGQLHWVTEAQPLAPHTHLILRFASGSELRYVDVRRFGQLHLLRSRADDATLYGLGPEPLEEEFTPAYLQESCRGRRVPIKALLLQQEVIAGLGNIYCDESLFLAGIYPERSAQTLTPEEIEKLWSAIRFVLQESIEHQGSSLRDYCNIDGKRGHYQEKWRVYQQTHKPCLVCQTPVERILVRGRSSHFCPRCQPCLYK